jgi:membrane protein
MSMVSRADAYQRRHRWAGLPVAVLYKFTDDQGSYLAAQITYYGFVAAYPLLLLLATILGYALHGNEHLQREVLDSALAQFPFVGGQITANIRSFHGSTPGLVIGMLGCVYGGLGIVQAVQNALNKVWGVPRGSRHNPVRARLRSLLLLAFSGVSVVATTVLSALGSAADAYGAKLDVPVRTLATAAAVALNVTLFTVAFKVLTARPVTIGQIRAGAIAAAVTWQGLQWGGTLLLGRELKGATASYGLFALVLGLVAWIYAGAATTLLCAEFNAVRAVGLWPRSLLAPFSDSPDLTPADRLAYTSYAQTERHKSFEVIDVSFGERPRPGPAEPATRSDAEPAGPGERGAAGAEGAGVTGGGTANSFGMAGNVSHPERGRGFRVRRGLSGPAGWAGRWRKYRGSGLR